MENQGSIVIYQAKGGNTALAVKLENDTVWLTQQQMAKLFGKGRSTITEHINNVFREKELDAASVCRNFRHTASDGKIYETVYYNLDVIISVGYRVKSKQGTQFRIWATKILKDHLTHGFTVNNDRLKELQNSFEEQKAEYTRLRYFLNKFLGMVARKDVLDAVIDKVEDMSKNISEIQKLVSKLQNHK